MHISSKLRLASASSDKSIKIWEYDSEENKYKEILTL